LDPGDALLFDGAVFHGGGANVTKSERRKVHGVFMIRDNLRPEENTYLSFPPEIAKEYLDEVLEAYGYEIQPFFTHFLPMNWGSCPLLRYTQMSSCLNLEHLQLTVRSPTDIELAVRVWAGLNTSNPWQRFLVGSRDLKRFLLTRGSNDMMRDNYFCEFNLVYSIC
jgi:hypothetical protein